MDSEEWAYGILQELTGRVREQEEGWAIFGPDEPEEARHGERAE